MSATRLLPRSSLCFGPRNRRHLAEVQFERPALDDLPPGLVEGDRSSGWREVRSASASSTRSPSGSASAASKSRSVDAFMLRPRNLYTRRSKVRRGGMLAVFVSQTCKEAAHLLVGQALQVREDDHVGRKSLQFSSAEPQKVYAEPLDLGVAPVPLTPAILQKPTLRVCSVNIIRPSS